MGFLILVFIIPHIYTLLNIFWIGRISMDAFAITEQNEFTEIAIQVLVASIPAGVLALTAQHYHDRGKVIEILKAALILQVALSLLVTIIIIVFNQELMGMIGTPGSIVNPTREYLLLKAITIPFDMVAYILLVTITSLQKGKEAFLLVTISIIVNILLDLILISSTPVSLQMGIPGVAIANLISQIVLTGIAAVYLFPFLRITIPSLLTAAWRREVIPLFRIGGWSGLETVVRMTGVIWILIILNGLGMDEYAGFGLATWIFWILLMPVFGIGQGTSVLVGNYFSERRYRDLLDMVKTSLLVVTGFMLAAGLTGILWWHPVSLFLNPNPGIAAFSFAAFLGLIIGFIGYGIGSVLRSIFYGTGQTRYVFYIGIITSLGIILPFFILVKTGFLAPTFSMVMMVYLVANIADPILAYVWARHVVAGFPVGNNDTAASA